VGEVHAAHRSDGARPRSAELEWPSGPATADEPTTVLRTALTGAAEVPGPGDADGRGNGVVRISGDQICVHLNANRVQRLTMAHIHEGPVDGTGPVVLGLTPPNRASKTCVTDAGLAADLRDDPSNYYLNLHNAEFPAGALRGQLG
jgi:hypothetical protein